MRSVPLEWRIIPSKNVPFDGIQCHSLTFFFFFFGERNGNTANDNTIYSCDGVETGGTERSFEKEIVETINNLLPAGYVHQGKSNSRF